MKYITILAMSIILLLAACTNQQPPEVLIPQVVESTGELKTFSSAQEIKEFLDSQQSSEMNNLQFFRGGAEIMMASDSVAESAPMAAKTSGSSDFSTTNVQVQGVDEADLVKNDGKYIYTITHNQLVIVDAFPAADAEIVSTVTLEGNPSQLFIDDNKLVVLSYDYDTVLKVSPYNFIPQERSTSVTRVIVYDITDKSNPKEVDTYTVNGRYNQARMIDGIVYVIAQEGVNYYHDIIDLPVVRNQGRIIAEPIIHYFDNPEDNYVFHTVMALDLDTQKINAQTFMMGYGTTVYMSEDNLYIAYRKNQHYFWYRDNHVARFFEVILPLLPQSTQSELTPVKTDNSLTTTEKAEKIAGVIEELYNTMGEKEKQRLIEDIQEAVEEYDIKQEVERAKTIIHKIRVDKLELTHQAKAEVPGYLLNQFSLDESGDRLRVATTFNIWARGESVLYNNVYVLDETLKQVGALEDIAPDERIYSTRFIGDRLYMVTFKQIDPFFVIDLSSDTPKILGELKIPGFSDYLHPYDENHIIGLGKDTTENEWGGATTNGVKLALFDVSDVSSPKEVDVVIIGQRGSDSEASRDHKAFLFDKDKNTLVIPVREVTGRIKDPRYNYYRNTVWQGAYVFGLTPESGFEQKGKITHQQDIDQDDWWAYNDAVRRSLYIDDVLYTLSSQLIKMNHLETLDHLGEVELPEKKETRNWGTPEPMMVDEIAVDSVTI